MCGKFTAKASWAEIVDFIYSDPPQDDGGRTVTFRVMNAVPVIVFHGDARRVVPMRWGFPDPNDWRRPRPIHARAETIDSTQAFAQTFRDGQRGIVLVETFNEAPDDGNGGSGGQHTVTPAGAVGIAFVWRRFRAGDQILLAAVMVTVAANTLLRGLPTDRMPAILAAEDWPTWLGENGAGPDAAKACLKTVDGARWIMTREERARRARRAKPTVSDPMGLF